MTIPKNQYVRLRGLCRKSIDRQWKDNGFVNLDLTTINGILMFNQDIMVPHQHVADVLAKIAKDLGLSDDGTGTNSYTMPGKEWYHNFDLG